MIRKCDVCGLVKEVEYCPTCDAWMCLECRGNPVARGVAAARRAWAKFISR